MQKELSYLPYLMQFSSPASKWGSSWGSRAVPSAGSKIPTPPPRASRAWRLVGMKLLACSP